MFKKKHVAFVVNEVWHPIWGQNKLPVILCSQPPFFGICASQHWYATVCQGEPHINSNNQQKWIFDEEGLREDCRMNSRQQGVLSLTKQCSFQGGYRPTICLILFSIQALFVEFGKVKYANSKWLRSEPSWIFMNETWGAFPEQTHGL